MCADWPLYWVCGCVCVLCVLCVLVGVGRYMWMCVCGVCACGMWRDQIIQSHSKHLRKDMGMRPGLFLCTRFKQRSASTYLAQLPGPLPFVLDARLRSGFRCTVVFLFLSSLCFSRSASLQHYFLNPFGERSRQGTMYHVCGHDQMGHTHTVNGNIYHIPRCSNGSTSAKFLSWVPADYSFSVSIV